MSVSIRKITRIGSRKGAKHCKSSYLEINQLDSKRGCARKTETELHRINTFNA